MAPTKTDDTKAMTLRLSRDQAEALEAVALVEERALSEIVREAIDNHIVDKTKDAAFQKRLKQTVERNRRILNRLSRRR